MLATHGQRLPAGGDDPDAWRCPDDLADQLRCRSQQVFAVIDDQQELLVPQVGKEEVERLHRSLVAQVQRRQKGVGDQIGISHIGQLDHPRAGGKTPRQVSRTANREPSLAHAAGADQADQAGRRELLPELGDLASPADEARCLGR